MKYYINQSTGMAVVSGKIKSMSDDRMVMTVVSEAYDRAAKKNGPVEVNVSSGIPYGDEFKPGFTVTAAGYQRGKGNIVAESASIGNDAYETQDLAVVSGLVKFAKLNEEKNADGTPKMKQDGVTPKKPHFDITISVNDGSKYVDHVIRVYEGNTEAGRKSQMDVAKSLFSKFDKETNRIRATIVTQPGQEYNYTVTKNGQEYVNYGCSHMGYKSLDVEFIDQKEKEQTAPAKEQPAQPVAQAPAQPQTGFDAPEMEMDEDELFT